MGNFLLWEPETGATISACEKYRYDLWRVWDPELPVVNFVGLNPSTADATKDDPTIRRCIGFAKAWGCGGLLMTNLFAFRSTDPKGLLTADDPVGEGNQPSLLRAKRLARYVIAAWGVHGTLSGRDAEVMALFGPVQCLGYTKDGHPRHPLYVRADAERQPYPKPSA
jgi:hypothetical protein